VAFAVPIALALGGIDYVEPRNLLGSLVPLVVIVAAGIDVGIRSLAESGRTLGVRAAPAAAPIAVLAGLVAVTSVTPSLQRYDWRALGRLVASTPRAGVILADPRASIKPLYYFLGRPLEPLTAANYRCGVRSRTIVTISRHPPRSNHVYGFGLVRSRRTAQGWWVDTFRAPTPRPLDSVGLRDLRILSRNAVARVDRAAPITYRAATRESLLAWSTAAWAHRPRFDAGWSLARPARRSRGLVDPPGWPPTACLSGGTRRPLLTASAAGRQGGSLAAGAAATHVRRDRRLFGRNSRSSSRNHSIKRRTSGI
jgi:hypothetical protein